MIITVFRKTDGMILRTVDSNDHMTDTQCSSEEDYLEVGPYGGDTYYVDGVVLSRSAMSISLDKTGITANGTDKATISNCPEDAEVFSNGDSIGIVGADGLVEITSTVPKTINLEIILFPYLNWTGVINAT